MNADGTDQRQLAAVGSDVTPAWSPDGTKIAFLGGFPDMRVYVINANGTYLRRLAPPVSQRNQGCSPAWAPNGKHIAFSPTDPKMEGGSGGIYLMNPDGRNAVHLQGTTGFICGINWQRTPA